VPLGPYEVTVLMEREPRRERALPVVDIVHSRDLPKHSPQASIELSEPFLLERLYDRESSSDSHLVRDLPLILDNWHAWIAPEVLAFRRREWLDDAMLIALPPCPGSNQVLVQQALQRSIVVAGYPKRGPNPTAAAAFGDSLLYDVLRNVTEVDVVVLGLS
jgi:hypothetical protein